MRVFVTGASGWIGRGLVAELISAGHTVVGLARSDTAADALRRQGAVVLEGNLDDSDLLFEAAKASDAVAHLAFKHDIAFSGDFSGAARADRAAIEALGRGLAGTDRPLVIATGILGVLGLPAGVVATERDGLALTDQAKHVPISGGETRIENAHYVLSLADEGVRSVVVRLPPATHGTGDNGFMATAIDYQRKKGATAYVGDGANRWPAVHRDDAASLFRLAVESAPAGSVLHAVGEEAVPIRAVAEAMADGLGVDAVSVSGDEAQDYVGWLGGFWGFDGPASSAATRELLGWQPKHVGLIDDLRAGHYYR